MKGEIRAVRFVSSLVSGGIAGRVIGASPTGPSGMVSGQTKGVVVRPDLLLAAAAIDDDIRELYRLLEFDEPASLVDAHDMILEAFTVHFGTLALAADTFETYAAEQAKLLPDAGKEEDSAAYGIQHAQKKNQFESHTRILARLEAAHDRELKRYLQLRAFTDANDPTRSDSGDLEDWFVALRPVIALPLVVAATACGSADVDQYEQTWETPYQDTTCVQWTGEVTDQQQFVMAADMLTAMRLNDDEDAEFPDDQLFNEMVGGIQALCEEEIGFDADERSIPALALIF